MSTCVSQPIKEEPAKEPFDMAAFRESLEIAEKQAKAELVRTGSNVGSSLATIQAVRKLSSSHPPYRPPRQLLMYLVRMGSFTSIPRVPAVESQDQDLEFPPSSLIDLLARCTTYLHNMPARITRKMNIKHKQESDQDTIRVFQWNHLSQTLAVKIDNFMKSAEEVFDWKIRRWKLLEEILIYDPDIICLQEVDHYDMLNRALSSVGYDGSFVPKPDSPCIYFSENTGPDGCAIFYKKTKFDLVKIEKKILEVWQVQSNQVAMMMKLRIKDGNGELCVCTTHLKARTGALLSTLRNEQGKDLLQWIHSNIGNTPLILTGDFNAEPHEPVYATMTSYKDIPLSSAYASDYTTWKIRKDGEYKQNLDYIFHSSHLNVTATLQAPSEEKIGPDRLPNLKFPSDHISLVADFKY